MATMTLKAIKILLDTEVESRNNSSEISAEKPDPIMVAKHYNDESIALVCALFAYGNAKLIVKFLQSLDFSLLEAPDEEIRQALQGHYYRFQNAQDVAALFIALKRLKKYDSIENIFYEGYKKEGNILEGLWHFIAVFREIYPYESKGYNFLLGSKIPTQGTYKRYMMYLRWMVRKDAIDLGLWTKIDKKDLLMPLDTHTFKVSQRLGLLKRKSYDMKASIALTQKLRKFDKNDPLKYDFAIYRLGQEKLQ